MKGPFFFLSFSLFLNFFCLQKKKIPTIQSGCIWETQKIEKQCKCTVTSFKTIISKFFKVIWGIWGLLILSSLDFGGVQTKRKIRLGFSRDSVEIKFMCIFSIQARKAPPIVVVLILPSPPKAGAWSTTSSNSLLRQPAGPDPAGGTLPHPQLCNLMMHTPRESLREMHRATARPQVLKACICSPNVTSRCLSLPRSPNRRGFLQQAEGRHKNASPRASDRGDVR